MTGASWIAARDPITAAVAQIAEARAVIEQAKGMLILLYGVDDESAFEMLRRRSQNTNIKLRVLAEQLVSDYRALSNGDALRPRSVYEKTLTTGHERISTGHVEGPRYAPNPGRYVSPQSRSVTTEKEGTRNEHR